MTKPIISLEAGLANGRAITTAHGIPWKLPTDRKYWRDLVKGHAIVVGDTTYKEQGVLEGSFNVVVSHDPELEIPSGSVATSVEAALEIARQHETEEIFVVGGASIFDQTVDQADRLYLTLIDLDVPDGSRFFPEYEADFHLIKEELHSENGLDFRFTIWERNA